MKQFLSVVLISFCLSFLVPLTFAQTVPEIPNLTLRCLDATNISESKSQHFVELSGVGFEPNQPVEVWRDTEEGFVCAVDKNRVSLCGNNTLSAKNPENFMLMEMTKDQVVADSNGRVQITKTRSRTPKRLTHRFYGAQKTPAVTTTGELPEITSDDYGLKLLTFLREQEQSSPSGSTNCATVFFDPYGRVFDAISLEPIANVSVLLEDTNKNQVPNQPGVTNPYITGADGSFSFFVADGTYYLNPKHQGYSFPVADSLISSLLTSQTTYYELYKGEPIIQQGAIQHRDIPMMPLDPTSPTNAKPVIMDLSIVPYSANGVSYQKVGGIVSHPGSSINVYSGSRLVGSTTANQQGDFEILIDNADIDQTLPLDVLAEKKTVPSPTPISQTLWQKIRAWLVKPVFAQANTQSDKVSIYPKPSFLMGFSYDRTGKIVPLSTVEIIVPQMNGRVFAVVKADVNGFVVIPHNLLPPIDYQLRIKDQDNAVANEQQPADFISVNQAFLETEKINLLHPETEQVVKVAQSIKENGASYTRKYAGPTTAPTTAAQTNESGSSSIYVILTFLVIVAVGALIVVLNRFKTKYSSPLQSP